MCFGVKIVVIKMGVTIASSPSIGYTYGMIGLMVFLGFVYLFAVWVLDIFDTDTSKGNQFVIAFIIGLILVYWRIGKYVIQDDGKYVAIGVLILVSASIYKSRIENS